MKVEITKAQLLAIVEAIETLYALRGDIDMEFNNAIKKQVKLTNAFLKKNGYKEILTN